MDCLYIGDLGGTDYGGNVQVTLCQLRRPDADRLIGKPDWQRMAVSFAIDCDRADA